MQSQYQDQELPPLLKQSDNNFFPIQIISLYINNLFYQKKTQRQDSRYLLELFLLFCQSSLLILYQICFDVFYKIHLRSSHKYQYNIWQNINISIQIIRLSRQQITKMADNFGGGDPIIFPPPEMRGIIDKMADHVANHGVEFEKRAMKESSAKLAFLSENNPYRPYFMHAPQQQK